MSEISDILFQMLTKMADEIKQNIPKVTGETANSIEVRIKEEKQNDIAGHVRGEIWGSKALPALEFGRGPTKTGARGTQSLQEKLFEWIQARGIQANPRYSEKTGKKLKDMTQEQLSWAMAIKIHKEGNELFRRGGKSGVLSNVINDQRLDVFISVFNSKLGRVILTNILKQNKK